MTQADNKVVVRAPGQRSRCSSWSTNLFPSCFSNPPVDRSRRGYEEVRMVSSLVSCAWLKQQLDEKRQDIRVLDGTA